MTKVDYPDKIYPKLEVVEKDICGVTHYGVVRVYNFFGIKFKRHWKVVETFFWPRGRISRWGNRWHTSKAVAEDAILHYYRYKEHLFRMKRTK